MKMLVEVTQEDIENGVPGEADRCPIALALMRVLPGKTVEVLGDEAAMYCSISGEMEKTICLGEEARVFTMDFDSLKMVNPFRFVAELNEIDE